VDLAARDVEPISATSNRTARRRTEQRDIEPIRAARGWRKASRRQDATPTRQLIDGSQ